MSASSTVHLRGDEGDLFRRHNRALVRAVRRTVNTSEANIEDACANAWTLLMRHQPARGPSLFTWLHVVARREALRLHRGEARGRAESMDAHAIQELAVEQAPTALRTEAVDALQAIARLGARQRDLYALHIAGFSYSEIASRTGDTRRTVERQLQRAHRRVRHPRRAAGALT